MQYGSKKSDKTGQPSSELLVGYSLLLIQGCPVLSSFSVGDVKRDDAIRSLVISYKLLGTREWFVIHHSDCGMETFTDQTIRNLLASSLKTAKLDENGWHDIGEEPSFNRRRVY